MKNSLAVLLLSVITVSCAVAEEIAIPYFYGESEAPNACQYYPKPKIRVSKGKYVLTFKGKDYVYNPNGEEGAVGIRQVAVCDLNGDGKKEYIFAARLYGIRYEYPDRPTDASGAPWSAIFICSRDGQKLTIDYYIMIGEIEPSFELKDIDKDGKMDIIARGFILTRWTCFKIVSWKNNKYSTLFEDESFARVRVTVERNRPTLITITNPCLSDTGGIIRDGPTLTNKYVWTEKGFMNIDSKKIVKNTQEE